MTPTLDPAAAALPGEADVVIIGGGVMGASIAFHLAEAGIEKVVLLERDQPGRGSSGKPIGGVRAQFSDPLNIRLGQRSLEAWHSFAQRPGADIGLETVGYLFLLGDDVEVSLVERSVADQNALGVPSRLLTPHQAQDLCPYISPQDIVAAAYSPADGWALPPVAVQGYLRGARRQGATVVTDCRVTGIDSADGILRAVHSSRGTVRSSTVICCAGAWSRNIAAMAGVDLPVVPLRRQVAFTGPLRPAPPRIPFTLDLASTMYVHNDRADGLVLGLSDSRQEEGFGRDVTQEWLEPFREAARRRAPGLADLPVVDGWAGLYEMTPDHNALIGETEEVSRFLYATGFSGHGFLQAPAVGEIMRDLCLGATPSIDVGPLSAERFSLGGRGARPEAHII